MKELRQYQKDAINAIINHYNTTDDKNKIIVAMPTGTGKSLVIAEYINLLTQWFPDVRILMITHKMELIWQNKQQLNERAPNINIGVYSASLNSKQITNVTFAGIDSIYRAIAKFGIIDYVLIDECHLVSDDVNTMYSKVLSYLFDLNKDMKLIGFTATPWRMKDGALVDTRWWDKVVYNLCSKNSFVDMINNGYLCELIPFAQPLEYKVDGIKTTANDFNLKELQERVDTSSYTVPIVKDFLEKIKVNNCKKTIIFSSGLDHSQHIKNEIEKYGYSAVIVDSKLNYDLRIYNIERFKQGGVDFLINYNVLTTGFDCPNIDCIVIMRPTKSSVLWVQALGRGTRPAPDKKYCMVLDYGGNTKRLGTINDPFIPKKNEKKSKGMGRQPIKECKKCGAINHLSAKQCVFCGEEFPVHTNLTINSSKEELISKENFSIDKFNVLRFFGEAYTSKSGRKMFRIAFDIGTTIYYEYLDVLGTGYSYHKAKEIWGSFTNIPLPNTIEECVELEDKGVLNAPSKIRVWLNPPTKYPKILNYIFDEDYEDDIPF